MAALPTRLNHSFIKSVLLSTVNLLLLGVVHPGVVDSIKSPYQPYFLLIPLYLMVALRTITFYSIAAVLIPYRKGK